MAVEAREQSAKLAWEVSKTAVLFQQVFRLHSCLELEVDSIDKNKHTPARGPAAC